MEKNFLSTNIWTVLYRKYRRTLQKLDHLDMTYVYVYSDGEYLRLYEDGTEEPVLKKKMPEKGNITKKKVQHVISDKRTDERNGKSVPEHNTHGAYRYRQA